MAKTLESTNDTVKKRDYQGRITAAVTPKEALEKINRVSSWWGTNFEGKSQAINDVFTIRFGDTFVKFKIADLVPDKKVVWEVTDCYLHWIENKTEWTGTSIVWEVSADNQGTRIDMTHAGLTPEVECFNDCKIGWDSYLQQSLASYLKENIGHPDEY